TCRRLHAGSLVSPISCGCRRHLQGQQLRWRGEFALGSYSCMSGLLKSVYIHRQSYRYVFRDTSGSFPARQVPMKPTAAKKSRAAWFPKTAMTADTPPTSNKTTPINVLAEATYKVR